MQDNDQEDVTFKLFSDTNREVDQIESRFVKVQCSAVNQETNIIASNHDSKFRRDYGIVNKVLFSADKKQTYFITKKGAVY